MSMNAASIMTHRVVTVEPDDTVAAVAGRLARHGISAAPVCDKDGKLLGMISEGDLLRPFAQDNKLLRSWWLSMLADGAELAPAFLNYMRSDRRRARDLMIGPVITANEAAGLSELAALFLRHRIKRVPIVRDGKLVGVVSRADLISALARAPEVLSSPSEAEVPIGSTRLPWRTLRAATNQAKSPSNKRKNRTPAAPDC